MKNNKVIASRVILHTVLMVVLVLLLYPLAMALWCGLKNQPGFNYARWYPTFPLYFSNVALAASKLSRYMLNTVIVAVCGTIGMLFIASLSAYTFARLKFPGKSFLYMGVLALMMMPGVLTLVPSYMLYKSLIGLNNYMILILPQIVSPIFGIFLLRSFFEGIPEDIFEAAKIDGANEIKLYIKICLPLSIPILGTLAIMQVTGIWNDYLWPMITIKSNDLYTISAGILINYVGAYSSNYPAIFAGYLVSSLPLVFLFVFANKYYIEGLASSAMKL